LGLVGWVVRCWWRWASPCSPWDSRPRPRDDLSPAIRQKEAEQVMQEKVPKIKNEKALTRAVRKRTRID